MDDALFILYANMIITQKKLHLYIITATANNDNFTMYTTTEAHHMCASIKNSKKNVCVFAQISLILDILRRRFIYCYYYDCVI